MPELVRMRKRSLKMEPVQTRKDQSHFCLSPSRSICLCVLPWYSRFDFTSITFFCARPHGALYINLHLILRATLWAHVVFLIVYPQGSLVSQPPILCLHPPILVFAQGSRRHKHWSYPLLQERGFGDIALIDIGNGGGFPVFTHQFMGYGFLGDSEGAVVPAVSLGW